MENVEFVNLTPHEITLVREDGEIRIPPSGKIARDSEGRIVGVKRFQIF